jgi:hypothetical protein
MAASTTLSDCEIEISALVSPSERNMAGIYGGLDRGMQRFDRSALRAGSAA